MRARVNASYIQLYKGPYTYNDRQSFGQGEGGFLNSVINKAKISKLQHNLPANLSCFYLYYYKLLRMQTSRGGNGFKNSDKRRDNLKIQEFGGRFK